MNDDKIKKTSDPSEKKADTADSRFDVLDNLDFDDVGSKDYSVTVSEESSGDKVENTLDDLLSELDEMERRTEEWQNNTDIPYFAPASGFAPAGSPSGDSPAEPKKEAKYDTEAILDTVDQAPEVSADDTQTIEFTHGSVPSKREEAQDDGANRQRAPKPAAKQGAPKKNYSLDDVDRAAQSISSLVETGKLSSALDLVLCLRGSFRQEVKEKASITIPLGSRDSDLRRIAAGALIQSYLDQGKIVRRDIENKLYAIIESSEPEYDQNDEIIEQSEDDLLYKVTACMVFAAELTERCGNHPDEKSAMYAAGDSVLDSFLADNMKEVQRSNKKRLAMLASAINASGGEVAAKFNEYYEDSKRTSGSSVSRFLGKDTSFWIATAVVGFVCLISVILYIFLFPSSGINTIIGKAAADKSPILWFAIFMELFFLIGMSLLCVIIVARTNAGGKKNGKQ